MLDVVCTQAAGPDLMIADAKFGVTAEISQALS